MKTSARIVILVFSALMSAQAQNSASESSAAQTAGKDQKTLATASPAAQPQIDPAKEADIRHLLELTGANGLVLQTMKEMESSIRPRMTSSLPPGDYREKLVDLFFAKFMAKADAQHFEDLAVPIYDKYLSDDEIKGLTQFYQTPLGQKTLTILPKLFSDCQEAGRKWGAEIGRQSMLEVFAEHPELQKALEDAQKPHTDAGSAGSGTSLPPQKPAAPQRIRVGGSVEAASIVNMVPPEYPALAKTSHLTGTVVLHVIIAKDGSVSELDYVSGPQLLMQSAIDAVKQWRYKPTLLNGEPVEVDTTVDVVYNLNK